MPTLNFPSPSSETNTRANTLSAQSTHSEQQRQKQASPQPSLLSTTFSSLPPIATEPNYPPYAFQRGHRPGGGLGLGSSASYGPGPNVASAPNPPASGSSSQRRVPVTSRTSPEPSNTISSHQHSSQSSNFPGIQPSHTRLSTLYEPVSEPPPQDQPRDQSRRRDHHSNRPKAKQPQVSDSRDHDSLTKIVDGVLPKGNFQLTTEHDSPSGTPTSLLRGLPAVPEPGVPSCDPDIGATRNTT